MSSHHFVKEGQEPALFVVDAIADDHLMSLLEWSPLVIVTGEAMLKVASWGIRVDVIVLDSLAHNESVVNDTVAHVGHADIIDGSAGQAKAVLSYLRSRNQHSLQVLVRLPERCFGDWEHADDFQIALIDSSMKWSRIRDGRFEKWIAEGSALLTQGEQLSVKPAVLVGSQITAVTSGIIEVTSPGPFWIGERHH
ncbi:hypothetical protein WBG78_23340 [Chryseolinea sp. T2]|uniref:hypothetical protein n=1 Tax=Chryseolinea sp. T2 TaxID=3129255 RepID=UPI0030785810